MLAGIFGGVFGMPIRFPRALAAEPCEDDAESGTDLITVELRGIGPMPRYLIGYQGALEAQATTGDELVAAHRAVAVIGVVLEALGDG